MLVYTSTFFICYLIYLLFDLFFIISNVFTDCVITAFYFIVTNSIYLLLLLFFIISIFYYYFCYYLHLQLFFIFYLLTFFIFNWKQNKTVLSFYIRNSLYMVYLLMLYLKVVISFGFNLTEPWVSYSPLPIAMISTGT